MTEKEGNIISLLRELVKDGNELVEGTMADVTPEQAHWIPPGVAHPIGATYAHVVISQDGVVNGMFKGGAPLFAAGWAGKTGVSELPPASDAENPGFPNWSGWGRTVNVDLPAMRKYAKAVYAATDEFLASLSPEDLDRPVDLTAIGLGKSTMGYVIKNGILGNGFTHCGEISCMKGLQGKRGYPFWEILEAAGVPKGSFYHYFKNKEDFGFREGALLRMKVTRNSKPMNLFYQNLFDKILS